MILLRLPEIEGDCEIPGYKNWITCTSIQWNLSKDKEEQGTGEDVFEGLADIGPIEIGKTIDKASPMLMRLGAGVGKKLTGTAEIHLVESGAGKPRDGCYMQLLLAEPNVVSWSITGDDDSRPGESIVLWYWKVYLSYRPFDGKKFGPPEGSGFDRRTDEEWTPGQKWKTE